MKKSYNPKKWYLPESYTPQRVAAILETPGGRERLHDANKYYKYKAIGCEKHKARSLRAAKAWIERHPERVREYKQGAHKRVMADPTLLEKKRKKERRWREENTEHRRAKEREAYKKRPPVRRPPRTLSQNPAAVYKRNRNKIDPTYNRSISAAHRALRAKAMPPWCSAGSMRAIYREALRLTDETGVRYEVDHIVPIRGWNVSGLHVPWNLRVVTFEENRAKHRSFSEADGLHPTISNGLLR